ncbi:hypothetical protein GS539_24895 [Rhodococcus hoagii]|nr:hypothetical protein [Prescottella equi]
MRATQADFKDAGRGRNRDGNDDGEHVHAPARGQRRGAGSRLRTRPRSLPGSGERNRRTQTTGGAAPGVAGDAGAQRVPAPRLRCGRRRARRDRRARRRRSAVVLRRRPRPTVYGRQHPGRRVRPGNEAARIGMDYRRRSTGRSPGRRRHGAGDLAARSAVDILTSVFVGEHA